MQSNLHNSARVHGIVAGQEIANASLENGGFAPSLLVIVVIDNSGHTPYTHGKF